MYDISHWGGAIPSADTQRNGNTKRWVARKQRERETRANHPEVVAYLDAHAVIGNKKFIDKMLGHLSNTGNLSVAQVDAVKRIMVQMEERNAKIKVENSKSEYVGNVGDRIEFNAVVVGVAEYDTQYGTTFVKILKQGDDTVIWKGSGDLRTAEKGDQCTFMAKIKEHSEREDTKQTIVSRPTKITIKNGE